ncbi:MAG: thiamine phosphate synthase [Roseobacter sp.]|jgi:thiamine-phosphate pyrophosphorylase
MDFPEKPQLYLISPAEFELSTFPGLLARVLDAQTVACVRLEMATRDEDRISRAADALREITHERDIALVLSDHSALVERLGLDGVHLRDASRSVRGARKKLGQDAIVGCFCGNSRHEGMSAGEAGADYVCFGPVTPSALGDGGYAERELFEWWSEMIEVPVVAEGGLDAARIAQLAPFTDFFAFGDEIWQSDDPASRLGELVEAMG